MPLPKFDGLMLPLLQMLQDDQERSLREAIDYVSNHFNLSPKEREQMLPSGRQRVIENRVGWARTFLKKAEMISYPRRGYMRILERGKKFLEQHPTTLTVKDLKKWPEFEKNWDTGGRKRREEGELEETNEDSTPEEQMEYAFDRLSNSLESDIIEQVKNCSPQFFEKLVVHLLLSMGYGGSLKDAGKAIGRSGDGGIDGIIKEDKLGLDVIYIQAKRWDNTIGRPDIQRFAGALQGNRAKKGVFITTSGFSKEALDFAQGLDSKLILIDGKRLAELMVEHDVGVSPVVSYTVKRIDGDYFSEE